MTEVNKYFPEQAETAIASYNYTDIVEGTGIIKFTAYSSETDAGMDYHLGTDETVYSKDPEAWASGADTATIDHDYDLSPFNLPRTIKGTAMVNFTLKARAGTGQTTDAKADVYIRKWDGTTETDIVTDTSQTIRLVNGVSGAETINMPLTVPTTHFKAGEQLRLSIVANNLKVTNSATLDVWIGQDPANGDGTYIKPSLDDPRTTTRTTFFCPFKLDI